MIINVISFRAVGLMHKIYKKGALDSQVIKFTSWLSVVGVSLASSTTKNGRHDIAEILLKVALIT